MSGEGDGGDRQVPDYAGKDGGLSGGPGGHAQERLDELISQRLPGGGSVPDEPEEPQGTDAEGTDDGATEDDTTDGDDPDAGSDEAEQEGTRP